jgi:hypothetical protein
VTHQAPESGSGLPFHSPLPLPSLMCQPGLSPTCTSGLLCMLLPLLGAPSLVPNMAGLASACKAQLRVDSLERLFLSAPWNGLASAAICHPTALITFCALKAVLHPHQKAVSRRQEQAVWCMRNADSMACEDKVLRCSGVGAQEFPIQGHHSAS